MRPEMSWRDEAACAGINPDLFFPGKGKTSRYAKRYCQSCPVIVECGDYANRRDVRVDASERGMKAILGKYGVWGGLSAAERTDQRTGGTRALRGRVR